MFTGIVREKGEILAKEQDAEGTVLEIRSRELLGILKPGDSISVDGVCLTVSEKTGKMFRVEVTPETLRRTNLSERRPGDPVNLEPSARLSDFLGGHLVQGHVDETGEVLAVTPEGNSTVLRISASSDLLRYCSMKGSIAVNGVSLTICGLNSGSFDVTIIPHTLEVTNFKELRPGERVNLEVDVISKYVETHVDKYVRAYLRRLGKLALFLCLVSSLAFGNTFTLGPHSVLVYANQTRQGETQFVLRLARYRPDVVLEWESETHQGTLHLYQGAVEEGRSFSLTSLFEVGVDMESREAMTVWLSREIYRTLVEAGEAKVELNQISTKMKLKGETTYYLTVNERPMEVPAIRVEDARSGSWTFLRDAGNPLLLEYASPYFRQSLKRISTDQANKLRWIKKLPAVK